MRTEQIMGGRATLYHIDDEARDYLTRQRIFDQTIWWWTLDGEKVKLTEMSRSHRRNLLNHLIRNAHGWATQYLFGQVDDFHMPHGEMAMMDYELFMEAEIDLALSDPVAYMRSKSFVQELSRLVEADKQPIGAWDF